MSMIQTGSSLPDNWDELSVIPISTQADVSIEEDRFKLRARRAFAENHEMCEG